MTRGIKKLTLWCRSSRNIWNWISLRKLPMQSFTMFTSRSKLSNWNPNVQWHETIASFQASTLTSQALNYLLQTTKILISRSKTLMVRTHSQKRMISMRKILPKMEALITIATIRCWPVKKIPWKVFSIWTEKDSRRRLISKGWTFSNLTTNRISRDWRKRCLIRRSRASLEKKFSKEVIWKITSMLQI